MTPALAVVRNFDSPLRLTTAEQVEDFEQEIVDQYSLAMAGAGLSDSHMRSTRAAIVEFARFLGEPLWRASAADADRFLLSLRRDEQARATVYTKACYLARFYDFVVFRYQGDIHALTDTVVSQPIDEYNRPGCPTYGQERIPPSDREVELLFGIWGRSIVDARKYLPAARDYFAASLWRRVGLRIHETVMLDVRDWRPDLGEFGKLHVRHGKGSGGRGPKPRLVPAINGADRLIDWYLAEVRPQFDDGWSDPDAPMLPSERHDPETGLCHRVGDDALRAGLKKATKAWLPAWSDLLSPHVLRHYCASSLYNSGMGLKAVQELLGHLWLSTTTRYVHVHSDAIDQAWIEANRRLESRFELQGA